MQEDLARVETSTRRAAHRPAALVLDHSFALAKGIRTGSVDVELPDGRVFEDRKGPEQKPAARLTIRDAQVFAGGTCRSEAQLLRGLSRRLVGCTPDLQALLDVILSNKNWVVRIRSRRTPARQPTPHTGERQYLVPGEEEHRPSLRPRQQLPPQPLALDRR
ncbi:MAG: hypothetical protein H6896_09380 [Rhodovulum sp.]|nr:hypothetical protein [Rhodovulum sp.]